MQPYPYKGREAKFDRLSSQIKHINSSVKRKCSSDDTTVKIMKTPGSNKPITNNMVTNAKIIKSPPNLFVLCEVKISYNKGIKKMQVTNRF